MLLGLTGGIATGKSTFRQFLVDAMPCEVFDADAFVHYLLEQDEQVAAAIHSSFGREAILDSGRPDKGHLRQLIYADPSHRRRLESILHPLVREAWRTRALNCRQKGQNFIADIPLLYETQAESYFEAVIVVACSSETQIARLASRGIKTELAERMLASQWPIGEKVNRANHVIWNDGNLDALRRQARHLVAALSLFSS